MVSATPKLGCSSVSRNRVVGSGSNLLAMSSMRHRSAAFMPRQCALTVPCSTLHDEYLACLLCHPRISAIRAGSLVRQGAAPHDPQLPSSVTDILFFPSRVAAGLAADSLERSILQLQIPSSSQASRHTLQWHHDLLRIRHSP